MEELRRQGLSVTAISEVTGFDRKTVRKHLAHLELEPRYKPRPGQPSLLDPFKRYIDERLTAGVWNAVVLTRELRERNYTVESNGITQNAQIRRPRTTPIKVILPFTDNTFVAKTILALVGMIFGAGWLSLHAWLLWDWLRKGDTRQPASIPWGDVSGFASSDLGPMEKVRAAEPFHVSIAA